MGFNRTGYKTATGEFRIAYGTRSVVVDLSASDTSATGSVTITNQDKVQLLVKPNADNTQGVVTFNGQTYAKVEQLTNGLTKISYADGTFETW